MSVTLPAPPAPRETVTRLPARAARAGSLLRLAAGLLLLWLLARRLPWHEVLATWRRLGWEGAGAALGLVFLSLLVSARKWQLLLRQEGQSTLGLRAAFRLYLVGLFFNNFLPSAVGGDVVRAALAARKLGGGRAAASVLAERVLASLGLALPALAAYFSQRAALGRLGWIVPALAAATVLLTLVCFYPRRAAALPRLLRRWPALEAQAAGFLEALSGYRRQPGTLALVVGWSVAFQLVLVLLNYVLFRSMGVPLGLGPCLLVIPLTSALAMLPVSINGLGLREWSYAVLFSAFGVPAAQSVAVSLAFFLAVMLVSILGGISYVLER